MGVIVALLVNYFLPRERVVACWEKVKGLFRPLALLMEHPALRRCFYKMAKGCCTVRSCAAAFFQVCFRSVTAVYFWQEKCYDTS